MLRLSLSDIRRHPACARADAASSDQEDAVVPGLRFRMMVWRLFGWFLLSVVQRRVALVGDIDRDRATARLREGYASGQLTLEEFTRRTGRALSSRSRWQLRRTLLGVSRPPLIDSVRDVVVAVVTGAYVVFSLVLLLALALTLLIHGVSLSAFVVVLLVWLVPTMWLSRLRRGR
jgi:hypothetical protein